MNPNTLARNYDRLTAHERFLLMTEAKARGDSAELDRLEGTCPKATYRMLDHDYTARKDILFMLSVLSGMRWRDLVSALVALAALIWHGEELNSEMEHHLESSAVMFKSLHPGVERFCSEIGLKPEVLWSVAIYTETDGNFLWIVDRLPLPEDKVRACAYVTYRTLLTFWRKQTEPEAVPSADMERARRLGLAPLPDKILPEDVPPEMASAEEVTERSSPDRVKPRKRKSTVTKSAASTPCCEAFIRALNARQFTRDVKPSECP